MPTLEARATPSQLALNRSYPAGPSMAHVLKGGVFYKHPTPRTMEHDQFGTPPIPIGPYHARPKTKPITFSVPISSVPISVQGAGPASLAKGADPASITISRLHPLVAPSILINTAHVALAGLDPQEPTAAAYGNVVVYTDNTQVAFSVNSGSSFTSFSPSSMYSDDPEGGPCCDQDVLYIPQIGEFAWLLQYWTGSTGADLYRLAVFPPSAVTSSGLIHWPYWDIYASMLPGTEPFLIAYWATNNSTRSMAASDWPESSTSWSGPYNVSDFSWPNANYTSNDPSGQK